MTTEYKKPLPQPAHTEFTKPFWEGAKRHELIIPRCKTCSKFHFYPREECPYCSSRDIEWVQASGKARLFTFTIVRQPAHGSFLEDVPYLYSVVQLDEGVKMISNVIGVPAEEATVDMALEVSFDDVTPEVTLVKFKPA